MVISEAVKLAMEQGKMIYREKVNRENEFVDVYINPTNSYNACIVILCNGGKEESSCRNWNPTGDDLMADDWELWMGNEFNKKVSKI